MSVRRDKYKAETNMNLTSMVDILFMLLIIVLITAPMMHAQVDLSLPKSTAARQTDDSAVSVSIRADKSVYIDKTPIHIEDLSKKIWELRETKSLRQVSLRADERVDYGTIMKVIGAIKEGGIDDLGLVALPEKK